MIARLRVLLPYFLSIQEGVSLKPFTVKPEDLEITFWPPMQCDANASTVAASILPINKITDLIAPTTKPISSSETLINKKPSFQCNLLQIDFKKPDFDRKRGVLLPEAKDAMTEMVFNTANSFLLRLRSVTQAIHIRALDTIPASWVLEYLNDDETALTADPALFRKRSGSFVSMRLCAITETNWTKVNSLPLSFEPAAYDRLLLDAESMLPDLGPAVVLTFSSLETLIATALNVLIDAKGADKELWGWIQSRDDDYRKEPSVAEEFDVMLKSLSGSSLKDKTELWTAFQKLRNARNNFIHNGILALGRKTKTLLSAPEVYELIRKSKEIVAFVESLLPEDSRRPVSFENIEISQTHVLFLVPGEHPTPNDKT